MAETLISGSSGEYLDLRGGHLKAYMLGLKAAQARGIKGASARDRFAQEEYLDRYRASRSVVDTPYLGRISTGGSGAPLSSSFISSLTRAEQRRITPIFDPQRSPLAISALTEQRNQLELSRISALADARNLESARDAQQKEAGRRIVQAEHERAMRDARLVGRGQTSGIALANKLAASEVDERNLREQRIAAANRAEDIIQVREAKRAISQARAKKFLAERNKPRTVYKREDSPQVEDRRERANTKIGVENAIFGSRGMKFFRQMFGYGFGYGHIIRSVAQFAIGNSLISSERALQTSLASLTTGASFKDLYGAGGIAKLFGGNERDAASMYASINAFRSGALMGRGMGQLGKLLDYRTTITPFMSEKEILNSIARRYHELGVERGAGIQSLYAAETGLSAPIIKAMSEHWENFSEWMENEMPKISDAQQEMLEDQSRAARELSVAWENLKDVVAIDLIPALRWLTDWVKDFTGDRRYRQELEWIKKNHPEWTVKEQAEYIDKQGLGDFIPKRILEGERKFGVKHGLNGMPLLGFWPEEKDNPLYTEHSKLKNSYKKLEEAPVTTPIPSVENKTSGVFQIDINSSHDMYGLAVALGNTARSYLGEEGIGINIRSVA